MVGLADAGPVLIAEDDAELLARLREPLRAADLLVVTSRTVRSAIDAAEFHRPAVVIVDLAMEAGRGWELLHALGTRPGTAVLALDRRGDGLVRRGAFSAGAADVVGPPLDATEIAARARALEQRDRQPSRQGTVLRHRDLVLDVPAHEIRAGGHAVSVTPQQFAILRALLEAKGATLHRSQLLARIAAVDDEPPSERAVDLHVSRLRRRLGEGDRRRYIEAVYGIGYRLAAAGPRQPVSPEIASEVLDAMSQAVLVVDGDLRIRAANRAAARALERDDLVGQRCDEVMGCRAEDGTSLTGPACLGRAVLAGRGAITDVAMSVRTNGEWSGVDLSHTAVPIDGGSTLLAIEVHKKRPN
jgi:DNA-binding response OmpR family regulator